MKLRVFTLVATLSAAVVFTGCSKKAETTEGDAAAAAAPEAPQAPGAELIPGQNAVLAAVANKDYNGAVQKFVGLKAAVATPEQNAEYVRLFGELREELTSAAQNDPAANEALATLRGLRSGR